MANIEIDGKHYEVKEGENLLEAILGLGLDLPYFCWHPAMGSVGSCRQCAIKVYQDENDTRGKILMGCMTPAKDGMRIGLEEEQVSDFRDHCIEVTMANHPHDCPVCEEGGECHLQDVTIMSEHTTRRYRGKKKTYENQYLGPCINHEMNRCITCYRCVRFYKDYAGGKDLAAMASRENTYFGRHEDGCLESIFSGNLVEVCPTGVFTDKTLARSYNRKWDLQTAPSICQGCSLGCNIAPAERQGKIKRITNRYHGEINGYFICDKGRFAYDHINSDLRLRDCFVENEKTSYDEALQHTVKLIGEAGSCIGFGSEKASMEENLLLKALVGSKNFCSGMPAAREQQLKEVLNIYKNARTELISLKALEACDCILVLGEDLMASAPRMALSVRQATRNLSFELADQTRIPRWQDEAVRTLAQNERSPLIMATVSGSELDEIASEKIHAAPAQLTAFGFAVAASLEGKTCLPEIAETLAGELTEKAKSVAAQLRTAKKPLIIGGCSLNSLALIQACGQIATALSRARSNGTVFKTPVSFVLPEVNSLGLALLLDDHTLKLEEAVQKGSEKAAIFLRADIYKHLPFEVAEKMFSSISSGISFSELPNRTADKCKINFPAASFVEQEGTVVNNEGRAQRYFEVYAQANPSIKEGWRNLLNIAKGIQGSLAQAKPLAELACFDDVSHFVRNSAPVFSTWDQVAPDSKFRIAGMKIPRQPHRYSGRTSLQANIKVAENKAPEDSDSPLGFTMEGAPTQRPPALNALTWSPGWNSNEAINKFQDEIGGHLRGGDPGVLLLREKQGEDLQFSFTKAQSAELVAVSQSRLFDSCELTVLSAALVQRADIRVAMLGEATAHKLGIQDGDLINIKVGKDGISLPALIDRSVPENLVSIPNDIHTQNELSAALLPAPCQIVRAVS